MGTLSKRTPKSASKSSNPKSLHQHRNQYAAAARSDDGNAFIPDPSDGPARSSDSLAEELAEDYLTAATSGEYASEDTANEEVAEELGGPFLITTGDREFARGTDESNPEGADRESLPSPMRGV